MRIALLLLCAVAFNLQASWHEQHEEGWHWYQDPMDENLPITSKTVMTDPLQEMTLEREKLDRLRAEALLRPTEISVKAYIEQQNWASEQASRFSQVWDAVIRQHPQLDYELKNPVAQFARHIYLDKRKVDVKNAIEDFKKRYGFFFFFKESCPYCHAMAGIVKGVSETQGIEITAISLDGGVLKEFPKPLPDNGIATRMQVYTVPAIFAVDPSTDEWFPIVTGSISASDLEERILSIAEYMNFVKEEHHDATRNSAD